MSERLPPLVPAPATAVAAPAARIVMRRTLMYRIMDTYLPDLSTNWVDNRPAASLAVDGAPGDIATRVLSRGCGSPRRRPHRHRRPLPRARPGREVRRALARRAAQAGLCGTRRPAPGRHHP